MTTPDPEKPLRSVVVGRRVAVTLLGVAALLVVAVMVVLATWWTTGVPPFAEPPAPPGAP